jgi:hypothetical protein
MVDPERSRPATRLSLVAEPSQPTVFQEKKEGVPTPPSPAGQATPAVTPSGERRS